MKNGFNDVAFLYDELFTESEICKYQRAIVWKYLEDNIPPARSILETNCGTGEDALFLTGLGHHVTATDGAANMISVATDKLKKTYPADTHVFLWDLQEKYPGTEQNFDIVYSNFGGWNCLSPASLKNVSSELSGIVKQGGKIIVILITKFCWWETFYYLLKLKPKQAFRRLKNKPVRASLTHDAFIDTYYYSTKRMKQFMQPHFRLIRKLPAGFFVPPSYLETFFARRPKLLRSLYKLDMRIRNISFFTFGADQCILEFEKI